MSKTRRQKRAQRRSREHVTLYLYGSDREDAMRSAAAFGAGYPELKGDLQHLLLACERRDGFSLKRVLVSLYHELALAMANAETGIRYTPFNSLADYEQDFVARGFPALLPYAEAQDFAALHAQCLAFDAHLQTFLLDRGVNLYAFATLEELQQHLALPVQEGL